MPGAFCGDSRRIAHRELAVRALEPLLGEVPHGELAPAVRALPREELLARVAMRSILIRRGDFAQSANARRACPRRQATTPYARAMEPGTIVGGRHIQARKSTCPSVPRKNTPKKRPKKRKKPPIREQP